MDQWMRDIRVGDVLATPNGSMRVVRAVSYNKRGGCYVTFTIKHCSWTHRCYTVLGHADLSTRRFRPLKANVALGSELDRKIARDLLYENRFDQKLDCCKVKGIA